MVRSNTHGSLPPLERLLETTSTSRRRLRAVCMWCFTSPRYRNFAVPIYTRVYEVNKMRDLSYLADTLDIMRFQVKIAKV